MRLGCAAVAEHSAPPSASLLIFQWHAHPPQCRDSRRYAPILSTIGSASDCRETRRCASLRVLRLQAIRASPLDTHNVACRTVSRHSEALPSVESAGDVRSPSGQSRRRPHAQTRILFAVIFDNRKIKNFIERLLCYYGSAADRPEESCPLRGREYCGGSTTDERRETPL